MSFLLNPKIFNYIIMGLYVMNCARWAFAGNSGQVVYWGAAFAITYSVTFMIGK